jgi:hypothetical protein
MSRWTAMAKSRVKLLSVIAAAAGIIVISSFLSNAADDAAPRKQPTPIPVTSLNSGEHVLVGRLGHPLGSYHVVKATFGMPVPKGRAGKGGRLYLQVLEVDGQEVREPIWIPYFKSMTLQDYKLPDGTDMFPDHPRTHTLNGKAVVCKVYEDLILLDIGGDVSEHFGNTQKRGFDVPHYETMLGILNVIE